MLKAQEDPHQSHFRGQMFLIWIASKTTRGEQAEQFPRIISVPECYIASGSP